MAKKNLSKRKPIEYIEDDEEPSLKKTLKRVTKGQILEKRDPHPGSTNPGDLLVFTYMDLFQRSGTHLVLVLGNRRSKSGVYKGKSGYYLSAVKLNALSDTISSIILENLYKNRKATYSNTVQKGLLAIVGRANYRTYIVSSISGCAGI